jgi:hypothetical protein
MVVGILFVVMEVVVKLEFIVVEVLQLGVAIA